MINIDVSLFIQIAMFLFCIIILNHLLYKPIRRIIQERNDTFAGFEDDISELTGKADARAVDLEKKMVEARREGFSKKDELKGVGQEEEKAILSKANEEMEIRIQKVKDQIKGEISQARDDLRSDLAVFSQELAQKVLGRSLQ